MNKTSSRKTLCVHLSRKGQCNYQSIYTGLCPLLSFFRGPDITGLCSVESDWPYTMCSHRPKGPFFKKKEKNQEHLFSFGGASFKPIRIYPLETKHSNINFNLKNKMWCSSQWGCGSLQSWPVNNHLENMNIWAKSACIFQSGHKHGCGGPTRFPTSMLKAVFVKSMRTIARAGLLSVFAQAATSSLLLWNKQSCRVQTSLPAEGKDFF